MFLWDLGVSPTKFRLKVLDCSEILLDLDESTIYR